MFVDSPDPNYIHVLTCAHTVDGMDTVTVNVQNREVAASVLSLVPRVDLALLAVPDTGRVLHKLTARASMGKVSDLNPGDRVGVVGGMPGGQPQWGEYLHTNSHLVHTARTEPELCGGAVVDARGRVVGINVEDGDGGRAVPIEVYVAVAGRMRSPTPGDPAPHRIIHLPEFGFRYTAGCGSGPGAVVVGVVPRLGMAEAGIVRGDVLVEYDGVEIDAYGRVGGDRLADVTNRVTDQTEHKVGVMRGGEVVVVGVTPRPPRYTSTRTTHPPHNPVEYTSFVGIVLVPMLKNHETFPPTIHTYAKMTCEQMARCGCIVAHVYSGSAAHAGGSVRVGDEITHVNDHVVSCIDDVHAALLGGQGDDLTTVTRDGRVFKINTADALHEELGAEKNWGYTPVHMFIEYLARHGN